MGKNKDDENGAAPGGPADSQVDADKRRNVRAMSSIRSRSTIDTTTIDLSRLGETIGNAHKDGASSARMQIDTLQRSLDQAHDTIAKKDASIDAKNVKIDQLIGQLAKLAEANVTQQLIEGRARLDETIVHEKYESLRSAFKAIGPAAGPLLSRAAAYLLPAAGDMADAGDKSPKSCAIRVFARLQDGSECSLRLISIMQDFAEDDWPGLLMFLAQVANAPADATNAPASH